MANATFNASSNDFYWDVNGIPADTGRDNDVSLTVSYGWPSDPVDHFSCLFQFPSITVPSASTINSAHVTVKGYGASDGVIIDIYGEVSGDLVLPINGSQDIESVIELTTNTVQWAQFGITDGTSYNSPDIKTIIQEIIDGGSWGSTIRIHFRCAATAGSQPHAQFYDAGYDSGSKKATLYIDWAPDLVCAESTHIHTVDSPVVTIANGPLQDNIAADHLHTADNVALTQKHVLTVQGADHLHMVNENADGTDGLAAQNVVSFLNFNGDDGSTTFADNSGKAWTPAGNAQLDTAQKKFGTASGYFDGTGDYISTPDHVDFDFGTGDFTIDFWVRFETAYTNKYLAGIGNWESNGVVLYDNGSTFVVFINTATFYYFARPVGFVVDTWYHFAVTRSGTDLRMFVDGTQIGTTQTSSHDIQVSTSSAVGRVIGMGTANFKGWIDEFRISNTAKWTSNFTPPSSAYEFPALIALNLHLSPTETAHANAVDGIGTLNVLTIPTTDTLYPATTNDDGADANNVLTLDAVALNLGHYGGYASSVFIRFDEVILERIHEVTNAYIRFTAYGSTSGATVRLRIKAVASDDASAPTNDTEWDALTQTTEYVDWSPGVWADDGTYDTPNIAPVLQEITRRPGWSPGNAIVIQLLDNSSDAGAYRRASSYDYNSGIQKPELHFTWVSMGCLHSHSVDGDLVLVEHKDLVVAETYHSHAVDNIAAMFVGINLTGQGCDHLHTVESITIVVDLVVASCDHLHTVDDINQTLASVGIQTADHLHTIDGPLALTQKHNLTVQAADHIHTTEGKIGPHIPLVNEADHLHTVDGITGTLIWVHPDHDEPYHVITSDSPALTQKHTLAGIVADHIHTVDNVTLAHLVVTQEAYHVQVADTVVITQAHTLVVQEAYHFHVPDENIKIQKSLRIDQSAMIYETVEVSWGKTVESTAEIADTVTAETGIEIHDWLNASDTILTTWHGTETLSETLMAFALSIQQKLCQDSLDSSAAIADTVGIELSILVREYMAVLDTVTSNYTGTMSIEEALHAVGNAIAQRLYQDSVESTALAVDVATAGYLVRAIVTSTGLIADTITDSYIANPVIAEALAAVDAITDNYRPTPTVQETFHMTATVLGTPHFNQIVAEEWTIADTIAFAWDNTVTDSLSVVDSLVLQWTAIEALTSALVAADTVSGSLYINDAVAEALALADAVLVGQILGLIISDALNIGDTIKLDGEVWECWVLNGNQFNPSIYSGFEFNSYATYNNAAYGCKDDGIYELTGATDAGTAIKSGIVLPETYFGIQATKRFRKGYFGLTSTGTPLIRLETESGSETYTITDSRAAVSRKLYGKEWILKLEGFDTLSFVELCPVILTR